MPRCNVCGRPLDMMTDNGKVVYVHPCEDCKLKVYAMRVLSSPPVDPDPIKLDESGEVVVLIKTVEGDLYLRVKGE